MVLRCIRKDGVLAWIETRYTPVYDENGKLVAIDGITRDITASKKFEEELLKSEKEFRTLAENSPDVIVRYDRDCRRIYVNPEFERVNHLTAARDT